MEKLQKKIILKEKTKIISFSHFLFKFFCLFTFTLHYLHLSNAVLFL